jgi:hypothetical protein
MRTLTITYNETAGEIEITDGRNESGQSMNVISFPADKRTTDCVRGAIEQVQRDAFTLQIMIIIEDVNVKEHSE